MVHSHDRRRALRIRFRTPVAGRVRGLLEVRVLDLNLEGARIEHLAYLRPGTRFVLELPPEISPILLNGRVVRSIVVGAEEGVTGECVLRYHTGIEFIELNADEQAILTQVLERLASDGQVAA